MLRFPTGSIRIGSAFCFAADLDLLVFDVVAHIAADTLLGHARLFDGYLAFGLRFSVAGVSAPSPGVGAEKRVAALFELLLLADDPTAQQEPPEEPREVEADDKEKYKAQHAVHSL